MTKKDAINLAISYQSFNAGVDNNNALQAGLHAQLLKDLQIKWNINLVENDLLDYYIENTPNIDSLL